MNSRIKMIFATAFLLISINCEAAFEFKYKSASKEANKCFSMGFYTQPTLDRLIKDKRTVSYKIDEFKDIRDFCQQLHEDLYGGFKYSKINALIRSKTK